MISTIQTIFQINVSLIFFVYGLVFFVLGLAITLQSRRHSRLSLARRLHWLALFGYIHGLHEWGDVFIPIQATYLPSPAIDVLEAVQLGLLAISFTCLFQFGLDLLRPLPRRWALLRWLPAGILLLWSLAALVWLTVMPVTIMEWHHLAGIWARYLIGFPGAALAAYALVHQSPQLIAPLNEPRPQRMLRISGITLAGYAIMGGLVVLPGPYFPANWLNTETLAMWLVIPVPIFRSVLGFILMLAVIRSLEIFDLEIDRKLSAIEETQILSAERDRIGRDLHDRTLQSVYGTGLLLNATQDLLNQAKNEAASQTLGQAMSMLDQAVDDIRRHIAELRVQPTGLSLTQSLTQLAYGSVLPSMVDIDLILDLPDHYHFETGQISHILAITGEALSNVARHAQARHIQVTAKIEDTCFCLTITDDGHGIPTDYMAGYGLQNMRDRGRLLGGELTIRSQPGQGTRLQLTVPREISK
ncbi:MAG: hypothetical protein FOGNACKC_03895 [Anaerolineae bacterium]|nr:hypothetical protein [Anaerolineae bacterium]